jgi:hypothetical protein
MAPVVIALTASFAFGALDQYLPVAIPGSWPAAAVSFAVDISKMSAPWLLVAFLAGAWQPGPRRAALVGLAATWLAVLAYVLMIVSPMEGTHLGPPPAGLHHGSSWAQLTPQFFWAILVSQGQWFAGGLITGPLFGWLGYCWRARKASVAAFVATLPVLLEPGARWLATTVGVGSIGIPFQWSSDGGSVVAEFLELAVGLLLAVAALRAMPRDSASART